MGAHLRSFERPVACALDRSSVVPDERPYPLRRLLPSSVPQGFEHAAASGTRPLSRGCQRAAVPPRTSSCRPPRRLGRRLDAHPARPLPAGVPSGHLPPGRSNTWEIDRQFEDLPVRQGMTGRLRLLVNCMLCL